MTAAASYKPEPYEVPEGGLASFLTATVGDWSDEALNADNYYDVVKPTADQLAAFGREEDDRIAHVATGETIIPMAVFEEDPELKEALFARMRDMGIEPERYIVGNELNSINPVTGQPEFFLKKIFKGIKKAVKGVVKVFKKIAPIVLSVVGGMFLGPVGAALGSGIGTLIQGGNLKDAFKSALISGVTAGVAQGIGQGFEAAGQASSGIGAKLSAGVEGFGESISSGLSGGYVDQFTKGVSNLIPQAAGDTIAQKEIANAMAPDPNFGAGPAPAGYDPATMLTENVPPSGPTGPTGTPTTVMDQLLAANQKPLAPVATKPVGIEQALQENLGPQGAPGPGYAGGAKLVADQSGTLVGVDPKSFVDAAGAVTGAGERAVTLGMDQRGFFQSMKDFITTGDIGSLKQAFIPDRITANEITEFMRQNGHPNFTATAGTNLADALTKANVNPGLMRRFAPLLAAGYIGGEAMGAFDVPPMGELPDAFGGMTGAKLLEMYPEKYGLAQPGQFYKPPGAANGGDIQHFPRKNGAIYGPGTETSDDIPAMLSDGEFVMTAKAVRGAGNGSREAGMRRMYDMMRKFEGGAARGY